MVFVRFICLSIYFLLFFVGDFFYLIDSDECYDPLDDYQISLDFHLMTVRFS
jgi:hypothetical protein